MSIPFIRYMPDGTRRLTEITRTEPVEDLARRFIACGGRYHILIEPSGLVRLSAVMEIDGAMEDVEIEAAQNGPALLKAVDRLIKLSDLHVAAIAT